MLFQKYTGQWHTHLHTTPLSLYFNSLHSQLSIFFNLSLYSSPSSFFTLLFSSPFSHLLLRQDLVLQSVSYSEQSQPIQLAADFTLRDYDSPDTPSTPHTLTLTLTQAVDGDSEGVTVEVGSGGVQFSEVSSAEEFTKVYVLNNGTSFSDYQQVFCTLHCSPHLCVRVNTLY